MHITNIYIIVGGRQAVEPPPDDPVVFVERAGRYARIEGNCNRNLRGSWNTMQFRHLDKIVLSDLGDINVTTNGLPCPELDPYDSTQFDGNRDFLV